MKTPTKTNEDGTMEKPTLFISDETMEKISKDLEKRNTEYAANKAAEEADNRRMLWKIGIVSSVIGALVSVIVSFIINYIFHA